MNKNEKAIISAKDYGLNTDLKHEPTMEKYNPNQFQFQYSCSFCACELADDGLRFNGVGACPACDDLAYLWVNSLREHAANYSNNFGGQK